MQPFLYLEENVRQYREKRLAYVVSSQYKPENHPIYAIDTDLGFSIFFNDSTHVDPEVPLQIGFK